jgi:hypothetical protein
MVDNELKSIEEIFATLENPVEHLWKIGGYEFLSTRREEVFKSKFRMQVFKAILDGFGHQDTGSIPEAFETIIEDIFKDSTDPFEYRYICNSIVVNFQRLSSTSQVVETLFQRISDDSSSYIKSISLDALFFILAVYSKKKNFRFVAMVESIVLTDSNNYTNLVSIVGYIGESWNEREFAIDALNHLKTYPRHEANSYFQFALFSLRQGLQSDSIPHFINDVQVSIQHLEASVEANDSHSLALALLISLRIVKDILDTSTDLSDSISQRLSSLRDEVGLLSARTYTPDRGFYFYHPIRQFEDWFLFVMSWSEVHPKLNKPSWMDAYSTMRQVMTLYRESSSIVFQTEEHNISFIAQPKIEAAFLAHEGLKAHLTEWLTSSSDDNELHTTASMIEHRITHPRENDEFLDVVVRAFDFLSTTVPSNYGGSATVESIVNRMRTDLSGCVDYNGQVATYVNIVMTQLILFTFDRYNTTRSTIGKRGAYLFKSGALEAQLGYDLRDFLVGGPLGMFTRVEVRDYSAGRVDVLVRIGGFHISIELKRSNSALSPTSNLYSQASEYTKSSVRIAALMILDTSSKPSGAPHIDQCMWIKKVPQASGQDIYVMTFVVVGNRKSPSSLS